MANIKVNNELVVKGKVSITRKRTEENEIIIYGSFMTHIYYEEINTLETERYLITGIDVYEEMYGSDDYNIIYNFERVTMLYSRKKLYWGNNNKKRKKRKRVAYLST